MNEAEIQQLVQIEAAKFGCVLMRNNSGVLKDARGTPVRFGLDNTSAKRNAVFKSSDLIGILPVVVTQEMVGQTLGVFVAVEVKAPDWLDGKKLTEHEKAQQNFLNFVWRKGGIASFVNSLDGIRRLLKRS